MSEEYFQEHVVNKKDDEVEFETPTDEEMDEFIEKVYSVFGYRKKINMEKVK